METIKNLFEPQSIAVIGASHNKQKIGCLLLNNKIKTKKERRVNIMKSPKTLFLILIAVCFSFAAITDASGKIRFRSVPGENTDGTRIIRLYRYGDICVRPCEITVKTGATVIWSNQSERAVRIHFNGKQVSETGKNHNHFIKDNNGNYVSNTIPTGAKATLNLVEKGKYNYVAEFLPGTSTQIWNHLGEFNGTIIVE